MRRTYRPGPEAYICQMAYPHKPSAQPTGASSHPCHPHDKCVSPPTRWSMTPKHPTFCSATLRAFGGRQRFKRPNSKYQFNRASGSTPGCRTPGPDRDLLASRHCRGRTPGPSAPRAEGKNPGRQAAPAARVSISTGAEKCASFRNPKEHTGRLNLRHWRVCGGFSRSRARKARRSHMPPMCVLLGSNHLWTGVDRGAGVVAQ
jgi:hypothetical protein